MTIKCDDFGNVQVSSSDRSTSCESKIEILKKKNGLCADKYCTSNQKQFRYYHNYFLYRSSRGDEEGGFSISL